MASLPLLLEDREREGQVAEGLMEEGVEYEGPGSVEEAVVGCGECVRG